MHTRPFGPDADFLGLMPDFLEGVSPVSYTHLLDMLPAPAAAIVLALLPTVSVALARRADAHPVPAGRAPRMFHEVNPTAIPWKILFGVAVYSFAIGAVKGVPVQSDPVLFVALTVVHHGVEIVLAAAMLWWVLVRGRLINFSGLWRAVLLFTAAALFLSLIHIYAQGEVDLGIHPIAGALRRTF